MSPPLARVALPRGGGPATRIAPRRDTWPPWASALGVDGSFPLGDKRLHRGEPSQS
ncbi:MAG: hypothetical protein KDA52_14775 [Planctomycetaceae bacterium]|nr:hypothetical protein [Planctomycetaceae bacterium]